MAAETLVQAGGATSRQARLAARVRALRTRAAAGQLDRWLLVVGGVLMPLGVLLIALGWLGASQTVLVFEQIPYAISGGLIGLAFVFAGGFVYFAYWQTIRVREARAHNTELRQALERIEQLLSGGAAVDARRTAGPPATGVRLVVTGTGSMVHRADCSVVAGRDGVRTVSAAEAEKMKPCRICQPFEAE